MGHRGLVVYSLIWWLLSYPMCYPAEKLSPDQKAPLFARGSGGLILNPPFEREPKTIASPSVSTNEDGVEREEIATFKLVDGELVRTVEGRFSYKSPEGIPVSVHYAADENGNRAGFRLGAAAVATGRAISFPQPNINVGTPGASTYLPPKTNEDRSYLPPH